jgi:hypothetical protein
MSRLVVARDVQNIHQPPCLQRAEEAAALAVNARVIVSRVADKTKPLDALGQRWAGLE